MPTDAERQNNTRGYGLARDVKAGQAKPVNRLQRKRRRRRARLKPQGYGIS